MRHKSLAAVISVKVLDIVKLVVAREAFVCNEQATHKFKMTLIGLKCVDVIGVVPETTSPRHSLVALASSGV